MGLQCEEMSMLPISSCLSQEEGGGRVGNQRLCHVTLGSTERLRQRILPKCKRCFCPESRRVRSERGQIRVSRRCSYDVSESRMAVSAVT